MRRIKTSKTRLFSILLLLGIVLAGCDLSLNPSSLPVSTVDLPFGETSISFGEITYDARLDRIIVPAAETGALALIEPETKNTLVIEGFSNQDGAQGAVQGIGATSATVARGMLFVLDQAAKKVNIINPDTGQILSSAPTMDTPEFVRFVSATNEIWVTEPGLQQIEVFKLAGEQSPTLQPSNPIKVPNGPEGLLIDRTRGLAFTNKPEAGTTAVIQVITHNIIFEWGNGCSRARGMAIDENFGYLFVACNEGKIVMMDINHNGAQLASQNYGGEIDSVAYNPQKKHIYLPSSASAIVAIFAVIETSTLPTPTRIPEATPTSPSDPTPTPASRFTLLRLGTADTAVKAHCITTDNRDYIWVCDPGKGRLFLIQDTLSYPPGG